ncbi:hypothetical protein PoB_006781700 [Plakobranchus ocellatus]|uniref:Uncharacterized protein n=1 Tax=Plakobranchus ocellatus TaxID=259542 RepID=A0AAV4DAM1_9GAST|nr:hypothetical protein PoB_006781700 [Plakobranchus ocellatus]
MTSLCLSLGMAMYMLMCRHSKAIVSAGFGAWILFPNRKSRDIFDAYGSFYEAEIKGIQPALESLHTTFLTKSGKNKTTTKNKGIAFIDSVNKEIL